MFLSLAIKSLAHRKNSVILTIMAMTVSIFTLFGVEHIRHQAKESFANTVSGVDLIVGARTGSLNLLLYSVFRIGSPTNNISWASFERIQQHAQVEWAIPISLGDSHKGYRVIGTTTDYFKRFKYANKRSLAFESGRAFENVLDVVLGADVANKLNYRLGDELVLAHGVSHTSFSTHDDYPFRVVGILAPTGTPVDQALYVSLAGIEAIHINWGQQKSTGNTQIANLTQEQLTPKSITAAMLGLTARISTFHVQRAINEETREPLLAILPGVALSQLWQMMGLLENTLRLISVLVLASALLGVSAMLLAAIRERQQEIQLLRAIGAPARFLFILIQLEALLISMVSTLLGLALLTTCLLLVDDFIAERFGLYINAQIISTINPALLGLIVALTVSAATIPALSAYGTSKGKRS